MWASKAPWWLIGSFIVSTLVALGWAAIWTLAVISAVVGVVAVMFVFADASAPTDATIAALPHGIFSTFGYLPHDTLAKIPNSLLTITLMERMRRTGLEVDVRALFATPTLASLAAAAELIGDREGAV